ncbi:hypothetical protein F5880DRAFT_411457 [Lentinula raphanica]|nr:hypothetical protein F5880DRAFT_411457 [Lentinula raphanica]
MPSLKRTIKPSQRHHKKPRVSLQARPQRLSPQDLGPTCSPSAKLLDTCSKKCIQREISRSVLSARQYHTGLYRREIIDWISFDKNDPHLAKHPKSLRGVNHPATLCLIIPQCHLLKVNDLEFVEKLRNSSIAIKATDWPAFLYDEDQVNNGDIEEGLFTGPFLFNVFYAIFFGIGSATTGKYQKNSIAARNGMKKVTGRNIAYAALQACFALSAVEKWNVPDGHFDYQDFYNEIVDYFEEFPEDEQSISTLDYWNKCVCF